VRSEECSIKYLGMRHLKVGKKAAIHYRWESRNKYLESNSFNKLSGMKQLLMIGNARSNKNM